MNNNWQDKFLNNGIEPYKVYPTGILFCADCLDVMKEMPEGYTEMIFTDPPYMISNEIIITRGRNEMKFKGKDIVLNFGKWDRFDSLKDYYKYIWLRFDYLIKILRSGGMLFSYFDRDKIGFLSNKLQRKYKFKIKGYYADLKSNPVPQARKVKWMNGWEEIGMWQKPNGQLTYNYQLGQAKDYGIRPIVGHTTKEDGERCHPTQKPISVARKFINYWSKINSIILDPFLGSGTTAVACIELDRNWLGIEISEEYCKIAAQRIRLAYECKNQGELFR